MICVIGSSVLHVRKIFQKKHFLPPDAHNYVSIKGQENIFRKILPKCKTNDRYSGRHPKTKENKANCFGSVDCQASSGVFLKLPKQVSEAHILFDGFVLTLQRMKGWKLIHHRRHCFSFL